MPRHERDWQWIAKIILMLERSGLGNVQVDEPIYLRDRDGNSVIAIAP
jgi:hypothetical protein